MKCSLCGNDFGTKVYLNGNTKEKLYSNIDYRCPKCNEYKVKASIKVTHSVTAGHYLSPADGECGKIHPHFWKYTVEVCDTVKENGMVLNFKDLDKILNEFDNMIDHKLINDVVDIKPTAENLAIWLWKVLSIDYNIKGIESIEIYETPKYSVKITHDNMRYVDDLQMH